MTRVPALVAALGLTLVVSPTSLAQDDAAARQACLELMIHARLKAQQPVQLSTETVTLTGDTLRPAGRATVRFDDTTIRFDEIVLSQSLKRIDFVGKGMVFLGAESPCVNPLPKIEFR
ncbi:MAG TPA: hypothetical protein VGQ37_27745 [Vicinamibacterales bacterium]|jgi:hypothetical protein|nr:hypothetical protein [Vicinamibacterales bacterium]